MKRWHFDIIMVVVSLLAAICLIVIVTLTIGAILIAIF
tara:strand:+ start:85 stop:198 length:114 start_codon:yes stop_codon:yes gene_type:complete